MKKPMTVLLSALLLGGIVSPEGVDAAKHENTSSSFDFYQGRDEAMKKVKTTKKKDSTPISNVLSNSKSTKRVIIRLKKDVTVKKQKEVLGRNGNYSKELSVINGFSAQVTSSGISKLLENDLVASVQEDLIVRGFSDDVTPSDALYAPMAWKEKNAVGDGVAVAVLDTGVVPHADLNGRIVGFKDFVNGKTTPYDDNGHGTHVSGIIAGNGASSKGKYMGVAPRANIVGVKVLDANEKGTASNVVAGIDWVIENKDRYNIKIINLSLGATYQGEKDMLMLAAEKASKAGLLVVAATGNNGWNGSIASPAISPSVLGVGSVSSNGTISPLDDEVSSFSAAARTVGGVVKPDVYAVGERVISTIPTDVPRVQSNASKLISGGYYAMSGTSMSTPAISGEALSLFGVSSNLTAQQVKSKILGSSTEVQGVKIANLAKAVGLEVLFGDKVVAPKPLPSEKTDETAVSVTTPSKEENEMLSSQAIPDEKFKVANPTPTYPQNEPDKRDQYSRGDSSPIWIDPIPKPSKNPGPTDWGDEYKPKPPVVEQTIATLPVIPDYEVNNAPPYVEAVHNGKDTVSELKENSALYKNAKEIDRQHYALQDIVALMNSVDKAFTREDFEYFMSRYQKNLGTGN